MKIAFILWLEDFGTITIVELDTTTYVVQVLIYSRSISNLLWVWCGRMDWYNLYISTLIASQEWCEFISEYECNDEYVKIHCPETCSSKLMTLVH